MRKKSISDLARDWWAMGLRGLAALVGGVIILVTPFPYVENLLRVFGGYLLADGVILLILAAAEARQHKSWAKSALNGLLGVAFGINNLLSLGPVTVRADFIAARTFLAGISSIIIAWHLDTAPSEWLLARLLLLAGVGSVSFSIALAVGPPLELHFLDEFGWIGPLYLFGLSLLFLTISIWLLKLNRAAPAAAV